MGIRLDFLAQQGTENILTLLCLLSALPQGALLKDVQESCFGDCASAIDREGAATYGSGAGCGSCVL